ncbi:L-rhamnose mutarotase [Chryseobacterium balustinum]|uniref:L-rhamnose mutarotase n=2 Tax=Chryseobacterium balustinum TaxID=246 RepID=A0AAX2IKJ9_9FLAO|nr:L-rhamnose mutarotase [Chryseobacterium balustinum]SKB88223.1 L-rhamnose mutarotase [Chryseobacterium balustinum]SQA89961.1 L-rhamnose mutarotase [Chryseobacterium balustinum]
MMKRIAFKMFLNEGCKEEYKKRHDEIWPELVILLNVSGVLDYSIFLDEETNVLFGVLKCNNELAYEDLPLHPIMQNWWKYMKDIMQTNADDSPISIPLEEVFYLQ